MRTPLTYYGGKQRIAPAIVALMPQHRVYLEPFAGGAAVLFAKQRAERETLNDLDGQIVRFWRALRDRPDELAAAIAATPYSRAEWNESGDETDDDVEAARRLLVNVDQSFAQSRGSWRPGQLTGANRWRPGVWDNLPPRLVSAAERLRGVSLECSDALELIPRWDQPDAVIYVDPPYTGRHRLSPSTRYRFDDDGSLWARLVDVLTATTKARIILSGFPCDEAEGLGWKSVALDARRNVRGEDGTVPKAPETLWLSPTVPEPVPDLLGATA